MRVWRHGREIDADWANLRALHYGDGHFTTMRVVHGRIAWWPYHLQRLQEANRRLHGRFDDWPILSAQVHAVAANLGQGVLKLMQTRSASQRGYASHGAQNEWLMFADPNLPKQAESVQLEWAATRLGHQPALAGMKHLNRLEQVLARDEQPAGRCDDVLMCDLAGDLICTTSANLFVYQDQRWWTPMLDRCGVAGVCRARILELTQVTVARLNQTELAGASEVFCCNAVRGIMPVARIGQQSWPTGPATIDLMARLQVELECAN
ncbi:aminodeoxychorismate lyase [Ahniella affigens]|uniref:Aminodeoxychorismate lyase n=1 Tax=Ahniella affigens TaxID=2021234 RepID=A0A2P1PP98_9GAMM|nr:aminodeoxychorismate lyase [Ahniella affigens]AVP96668.1 aminodeoxychorismate lyase [Ahniella affigens]